MSSASEGEMDTYESKTPASFEDCSNFRLERGNGCASQSCRSLLNIMCNPDSLYRSSDGVEEGDEQQTHRTDEEENTSGTTGM